MSVGADAEWGVVRTKEAKAALVEHSKRWLRLPGDCFAISVPLAGCCLLPGLLLPGWLAGWLAGYPAGWPLPG